MATRLPVQHKHKPHCPNCEADIPGFEDVQLLMVPECELLSVTFQVRCKCGSIWNLTRTVKQ
jgi:hypothetical protein